MAWATTPPRVNSKCTSHFRAAMVSAGANFHRMAASVHKTSKVLARPASNRHRMHDPALRIDCDTDRKQHPAMDGCERFLGDVGNFFMHC